MASESTHKQDFIIRNLPTRSVTLFPTRAQIVREITGVSLKPGQNQIVIEGLTPTVDEHSIKVEGTGAATITDLSIQLVSNKEIYEEIYPSDDESSDDEDDDDLSESEDQSIKVINMKIKSLRAALEDQEEKIKSASVRLAMLEKFTNSVQEHPPTDIKGIAKDYREERIKIYEEHKAASIRSEELETQISVCHKDKVHLGKAAAKAKAKAEKEKQKIDKAKQRKKIEVNKEKARIRAERSKFWPKKVFKVIISLDSPSGATPATSRRNSVDSLVKISSPSESSAAPSNFGDINLSLSYITYSASWQPRYDLSLNTVNQTGTLDFQAELRNTTCETWRDAKIVLSTSQTTYQGLEDTIPILQPWNVRLQKNSYNTGSALYSQYEQVQATKNKSSVPPNVQISRNELFGWNDSEKDGNIRSTEHLYRPQQAMPQGRPQPLFGSAQGQPELTRGGFGMSSLSAPPPSGGSTFRDSNINPSNPFRAPSGLLAAQNSPAFSVAQNSQVPPGGSLFGGIAATTTGSLFGNPANLPPAPSSSFRTAKLKEKRFTTMARKSDDLDEAEEDIIDYSVEDVDAATLGGADPALLFEQSLTSETGMTTTYDLPSTKTLSPNSSAVKHKIARILFVNIDFSHILIPKLKAAAFLKARLRNSSSITILKGTAGLTLDGSFLGQSTIPRCGAGDAFSLPLGVDPSITVIYSKPTVRRSQSGIFNKEDCEVFTRTATITNTKSTAPVELIVRDQIPVSEDERLRVEIVTPRGLKIGFDSVSCGVAAGGVEQAGKPRVAAPGDTVKNGKWGTAVALAKKGGEVNWTVKINPLKGCKLVLEYEATYPGGETVIAVN